MSLLKNESPSTLFFRWVWDGYSRDTGYKRWNPNDSLTIALKLESRDLENLLVKFCNGIDKCISGISIFYEDLSYKKSKIQENNTSVKNEFDSITENNTSNTVIY
ncbi:hypothetical protein AYI69_g8417 [Smittium culicis]|uniref:Uncharacterized protein n=1 Tax=Smittium culicis TaxID=133412 RepID=A0A1R1XJP8_9FUNG|nr:hypothetical protein AYI69_g8417 [Smittium culicis]